MKYISTILASILLATTASSQSSDSINAENFTSDPLLRQYIVDSFQLPHALQGKMVDKMMNAIPEQVRPSVPSLPDCGNEMRNAFGGDFLLSPLLSKLRSLTPEERGQFSGFTRFLHSPAGGRLLALNHQAMAVDDKPDADGMPQLASDHESKIEQMQAILKSEPASEELPQAMFGLAIYLGGITDDPAMEAKFDQAQHDVMGSTACKAMVDQVQAYAKAHPEDEPKP
jgi:hypothetical protein